MKIYRGPLGITDGQIFHVGWNDEFIIAKQHPECDPKETSYFIIDIKENQKAVNGRTHGIYGPMTKVLFEKTFKALGIPKDVVFSYKP